jgi:hypothetical protein
MPSSICDVTQALTRSVAEPCELGLSPLPDDLEPATKAEGHVRRWCGRPPRGGPRPRQAVWGHLYGSQRLGGPRDRGWRGAGLSVRLHLESWARGGGTAQRHDDSPTADHASSGGEGTPALGQRVPVAAPGLAGACRRAPAARGTVPRFRMSSSTPSCQRYVIASSKTSS